MTEQIGYSDFDLPPLYSIKTEVLKSPIQQIIQPECSTKVKIEVYETDNIWGHLIHPLDESGSILAITNDTNVPDDYDKVLLVESAIPFPNEARNWIRHPAMLRNPNSIDDVDFNGHIETIVNSWKGSFCFKEENEAEKGLRPPQIGAVHALLAHWTVSNQVATIVMPTGTGKTETMLSILVAKPCQRVLVVVPTDVLRNQISDKFLGLGILKSVGVVSPTAFYPVVGVLRHKPKQITDVDTFFEKCNVIVTTMSIAGNCSSDIQERMAHWCSDLFIDEAHHIGAPTWNAFKLKFEKQRFVQFTATPFRNDGRPVGGKIIFNYPLGKAQKDGYFRNIHFEPVVEYNPKKADQKIAEKAVEQLRKDREKFNHILMARVENIAKARKIFPLYEKYTEFHPVQIHSGLSETEKKAARKAILCGEAKIVVCVDMLGEGFDLPELKIAAFHDVRASLPITLQLAGRFVRSREDLGEPTFIANIADITVQDELRKLYSQDADWNVLLQQSSESVIDLWEFLKGFTNFPEDIPLQNIRPALSAVIYKTRCAIWNPKNFIEGLGKPGSFDQIFYDINSEKNVLVVVTGKRIPIDWAQLKEIYNMEWELLILFWDPNQNLLFINGSSNEGYYRELAQSVAGDIEQIRDSDVFRSLYGINRLRLQNVGLINQFGKLIKYTMRAGSDIETGLSQAQRSYVRKANIFGAGYEDGRKATVGCSYKGRIWSRKVGNLEELIEWCRAVGRKVLDASIDPDEVLKGTLVSETIQARPNKLPVWIDWPDLIYAYPEISYSFMLDNSHSFQFFETDIRLIEPSTEGDIRFEIFADEVTIPITFAISDGEYRFTVIDGHQLVIRQGSRDSSIQDFFYNNPPTIYFIDGSSLDGSSYTPLIRTYPSFSREKISGWDWTGIDIRKESQGVVKNEKSVQYRLIEKLKTKGYDLIFDDDDSGEIADIVAINDTEKIIKIELYHCKFSKEESPGARIDDLYAVCGQAQKSIRWMEKALEKPDEFFSHLLRRETKREELQQISRIEKGSKDLVEMLKVKSRSCPIELSIFVVQPGLSKAKVSDEQLELLGVTENYLLETFKLPFIVIASM
jgi:superfamily II DNA or RNA helicase